MAKANPYAGLKYDAPVGAPAPNTSPYAGLKYDEDQPATYSPLETVGLNAANLFNLEPAAVGAYQSVVNGKDYAAERDAQRQRIEAANEQNPISSYVGKGVALGGETLLGGAAGKAVSLGAKAVGATEALSPVLQKLGETGTAIAKGALGGAAYGAAGGAGEALSKGEDVLPAAAGGAAIGGALGGAVGGVAHKVGEAFEGAIGKQNESIVRGASERALPRKQSALAALVEDELPRGAKSAITASDVIQDNVKILKGLRSGDYETVTKASDDVQHKVSSLEVGKADNYKAVDRALGGGFDARAPIDALENKAATETEAPWRNVLLNKAKALKEQWSSIGTDEAKRYLESMRVTGDQTARDALEGLAQKLPAGKQWTKADFLDHLVGGERGSAVKGWADLDPNLRQAVEKLPFKFDGSLKIPSQDLRRLLTLSQDEAESALGTLNATKNARLASLGQEVLGSSMNRTLDAAAETGGDVAKAVQSIRDVNVQQSVLLKLNEAVSKKIEKLQLGKPTLGGIAGHGIANVLGGYEALGAVKHAITGDFAGAAKDAGAAVLAKFAPQAIVGAKRGAVDSLALLQREVARGNPRAIALLKAAQQARRVGTAGAGAIGAVTAGTLANQSQ